MASNTPLAAGFGCAGEVMTKATSSEEGGDRAFEAAGNGFSVLLFPFFREADDTRIAVNTRRTVRPFFKRTNHT
ncbi:hypothetical protein MRX96_016374 [Rhipicephalus microplus]